MARESAFDNDFDFDTDVDADASVQSAADTDAAVTDDTTDAAVTDDTSDTDDTDEVTEAPAPSEDDVAAAVAEHEATVQNFSDMADAAVEASDQSTGTVDLAHLEAVVAAYKAITGGIKFKNQAKAHVSDSMKDALNSGDIEQYGVARAYNEVHEAIMSSTKSGSSGSEEPKPKVSAGQVYADKVTAMRLALTLVESDVPDDADDWETFVPNAQAEADVLDTIAAHNEWSLADEDERGDEPKLSPVARAAVKLASGKSPTKASTSGGSTSTYSGPRRDVAAHIAAAFDGVDSGTFLTVAAIRAAKSDEYGDDAPSAGAIFARLFPKGKSTSVQGVIPGENEKGVNGATKA